LEDFVETIKNDDDKFVPRDGTVHQITSNVSCILATTTIIVDIIISQTTNESSTDTGTSTVNEYQ
jgi:hypothetical protein